MRIVINAGRNAYRAASARVALAIVHTTYIFIYICMLKPQAVA